MDVVAVLLGLLIVGLVCALVNYPAVRIILGAVILLIITIVYIKRKRPAIKSDQLDSVLILAIHVIAADGYFKKSELDYVQRYLTRKLKRKNRVEQAMERLQEIRQEKYELANACREVRSNFSLDEREQILRFLFH